MPDQDLNDPDNRIDGMLHHNHDSAIMTERGTAVTAHAPLTIKQVSAVMADLEVVHNLAVVTRDEAGPRVARRTQKSCPVCKEVKLAAAFYTRKCGRLSTWCRVCNVEKNRTVYKASLAASAKRRRVNNLEKFKAKDRDYTLVSRYGISREIYDNLLEKQDGKCALCGTDTCNGRGEWHVDHDHSNGSIRGLLCASCNIRLGVYESLKALIGLDKIQSYLSRQTGFVIRKRKAA